MIQSLIEQATKDATERGNGFGCASMDTQHGRVMLRLIPKASRTGGNKFNSAKVFYLNGKKIARTKLVELVE